MILQVLLPSRNRHGDVVSWGKNEDSYRSVFSYRSQHTLFCGKQKEIAGITRTCGVAANCDDCKALLDPPTPAKCPQGHTMTYKGTREDNNWSCDGSKGGQGCAKGFKRNVITTRGWDRYRCTMCDHDLCELCFARECSKAPPTPTPTLSPKARADQVKLSLSIVKNTVGLEKLTAYRKNQQTLLMLAARSGNAAILEHVILVFKLKQGAPPLAKGYYHVQACTLLWGGFSPVCLLP